MPFPPRTKASDAIANNLYADLTTAHIANGGQNRCMITVLTTGEIDGIPKAAFIATSGPAAVAGGVRTAINNLHGHGIYGGIDYNIIPFTDNANMINPIGTALSLPVPGDYLRVGARHCAEPKAIEAAAATGDALSGMSTVWWGNNVNAYTDPNNNPNGYFALPCEVCQANEDWIMTKAKEAKMVAKGSARRFYEV